MRTVVPTLVLLAGCASAWAAGPQTYRLYEGITAYVDNPTGRDFTVTLDVRDINMFASGPREVLVKIYDPQGTPVVREIIPDDGVVAKGYMPRAGGWDHEAWYYYLCYSRGSEPMIRWSAFSDPTRLATIAPRTFHYTIKGGVKGIYRVLLAGANDHYVTLKLDPDLRYAVAGHTTWLHGHGDMFRKSYVYVPKNSTGLFIGFAQWDPERVRRLTITTPDGKKLFDDAAPSGFAQMDMNFEKAGQYDDQLLTVEVSEGPADFMVHFLIKRQDIGPVPAIGAFAPDPETARAVRGGAIYHDGEVFWHMFQVRWHDWLKAQPAESFVPKGDDGKPLEMAALPGTWGWGAHAMMYGGLKEVPGFFPLNGVHVPPPVSDFIMHLYAANPKRELLNVALRDMEKGFRTIGPGEFRSGPDWRQNMGYMMGTYDFHYWRPAWRILQQTDAPRDIKNIIREALILGGDRLSFCTAIERVNGNAFSHIPIALRYIYEATGDPMQKARFDVFWSRFASEGWGEGSGISRSGDLQEGFAHDFHYGTYWMASYRAPIADLHEPRFIAVMQRVRELYSYIQNPEVPAYPWDARTHEAAPLAGLEVPSWKGLPGPDLTEDLNGGHEWFAARRANYYAVTFAGRLSPLWVGNGFFGRIGYGGGILCQLVVPGKGTVLVSNLPKSYGEDSEPANWPTLHINSVVGTLADGRPLVSADSEQHNALLANGAVTSSGEVRDTTVRVSRSFTFNADSITCGVQLAKTGYDPVLSLWVKNPRRGVVAEAYEMIPFMAEKATVTGIDAADQPTAALTDKPTVLKTIIIDRGGYGVRIELDKPRPVHRGGSDTVMIQLIDKPAPAEEVGISYRLAPFTK